MARKPDYERGNVRLYCGDALEVLPEFESGSIACVFTDPPYGHNNNNNGDLIHRREAALGRGEHGESRAIENDGAEANEVFKAILPEWKRLLGPGCCCCCCCGGGGPDPQFARWSLWLDDVLDFKQMVVWDKGPMGMGWHYRRSYETVLVAQKAGAACKWYDETNAVENILRPTNKRWAKIIPSAEQHPTQKPVGLAEHFISLHTLEGETVLDSFMGSGTTIEAAVRMNRKAIGIELDPAWFQVAVARIDRVLDQKVLF